MMADKESETEIIDLSSDNESERNGPPEDSTKNEALKAQNDNNGGAGWKDYSSSEDEDSDCDSLAQEMAHELFGQNMDDVEGACTPEEASELRRLLREHGPEEFVRQTIEKDISARKLLTAFEIRPPAFLEGCSDEDYYPYLLAAIKRELSTRRRLTQYNTVEDAIDLIKTSSNIVVVTGAGISTSLGIPDFRSKNGGLYEAIQASPEMQEMGINEGSDIFDLGIFKDNPGIFYHFAHKVATPSDGRFSPTHAFIRLLQTKGKLLTNYTQNIDNIEQAAGIDPSKLIQCHGSFATATCLKCKFQYPGESILPDIAKQKVAFCTRGKECVDSQLVSLDPGKPGLKRKRSDDSRFKQRKARGAQGYDDDDDEDDDIDGPGVIKPDITFFGEDLPEAFRNRLLKHDQSLVDLVLIIGTSLKVAPVSDIVPFIHYDVPQIIISRDRVTHFEFDVELLGEADVIVAELSRRLGWDLEHEMIPTGQKVEITNQPHPRDSEEARKPALEYAHRFKAS